MKLIGHKTQLQLLKSALLRDHLPHTLLFTGPQGIGKKLAALHLAAEILKVDSSTKTHDSFWKGEHPDLHLIGLEEDRKDISVEQARDFISSLQLKPYFGENRVAIIDEAHLLSIAASNSLLLTLEEAPNNCFIILVSSSPQRLLPTILSRSQEMAFSSLSEQEMIEILIQLGCDQDLTERFVSLSGHSLELLELSAFATPFGKPDSITLNKQVRKTLERLEGLTTQINLAVSSRNSADLLSLASQLGDKENSVELVFKLLIKNIRDRLRSDSLNLKLSGALDELIQLERATRTRNLNPTIQLADFFTRNLAA
jgi:DNA polymerase III gamma/tau subunit